MLTTKDVLAKVREQYPLPSSDQNWKELRADPEFFEAAMESVIAGHSVSTFARSLGLSPTRVNAWLATLKDENMKAVYEEARHARANHMADRILDICDQVEMGILAPPAARVIVDNLKWMAARLDPHIWGDKLHVKAEVKSTTEMHLEAVRELAKRVQAQDDRPVIEGEVERKNNE
jgi:hypothetical protein